MGGPVLPLPAGSFLRGVCAAQDGLALQAETFFTAYDKGRYHAYLGSGHLTAATKDGGHSL